TSPIRTVRLRVHREREKGQHNERQGPLPPGPRRDDHRRTARRAHQQRPPEHLRLPRRADRDDPPGHPRPHQLTVCYTEGTHTEREEAPMETLARDLTPGARIRRPGGGTWTVTRVQPEDNGEVAISVKHERTGDQD